MSSHKKPSREQTTCEYCGSQGTRVYIFGAHVPKCKEHLRKRPSKADFFSGAKRQKTEPSPAAEEEEEDAIFNISGVAGESIDDDNVGASEYAAAAAPESVGVGSGGGADIGCEPGMQQSYSWRAAEEDSEDGGEEDEGDQRTVEHIDVLSGPGQAQLDLEPRGAGSPFDRFAFHQRAPTLSAGAAADLDELNRASRPGCLRANAIASDLLRAA